MKLVCPKKSKPDFKVDCAVFRCDEGELLIGRYDCSNLWFFTWLCLESGVFSPVGKQYGTKAEIKYNAREYAMNSWFVEESDILI